MTGRITAWKFQPPPPYSVFQSAPPTGALPSSCRGASFGAPTAAWSTRRRMTRCGGVWRDWPNHPISSMSHAHAQPVRIASSPRQKGISHPLSSTRRRGAGRRRPKPRAWQSQLPFPCAYPFPAAYSHRQAEPQRGFPAVNGDEAMQHLRPLPSVRFRAVWWGWLGQP